VLGASTSTAAPRAADFQVFVSAGANAPQVIANGGTVTVSALTFKVGLVVDNNGGEEATARARFALPEGLRFGRDVPDPTEGCNLSGQVAECRTGLTVGTDPSRRTGVWVWDAVADRAGSYTVRAEVLETSVADPDASSNAASATIVVREAAPGGGSGAVVATAVRLAPAKPRAGSVVTATARVSQDDAPITPSGVACLGRIGSGAKIKGAARAAPGAATCSFRTPRSAKGKRLAGSIAFAAGGQRFTKRFSVVLA
jgi:hypothetical protein